MSDTRDIEAANLETMNIQEEVGSLNALTLEKGHEISGIALQAVFSNTNSLTFLHDLHRYCTLLTTFSTVVRIKTRKDRCDFNANTKLAMHSFLQSVYTSLLKHTLLNDY